MTLETQYKNYKIDNPNSNVTFDEWKVMLGKRLEDAVKQLNLDKLTSKDIEDEYRDIKKTN